MRVLLGLILTLSMFSVEMAESRDRDRDRDRDRNNGSRVGRRSSHVDGYRPSRDGSVGRRHGDRRNRRGSDHYRGQRRHRSDRRHGSGGTNIGRHSRDHRRGHVHARARLNWRSYHRRAVYHRRHGHRPNWNRPGVRYRYYRHRAHHYSRRHRRQYRLSRDYHRTIPFRFIYWGSWVRFRMSVNDGFRWHNEYPYYAYNGYLHRYSNLDQCEYELVDGYNNRTIRSYSGTCAISYDRCAEYRDHKNYEEYGYRYFCSERFDYENDFYYDWDYSDSFYSDISERDDDFYDDNY